MTAGCTSVVDGVVEGVGDPGMQTRIALGTALAALAGVGVRLEEVVAVRMSITDREFAEDVGQAHGGVFGTVRPVATMVVVAGLLDPAMLVEVELTAWAN
jgi:enamine deaminase RidA (YjgF/YER057c/UK114 family)